MAEEFCDGYNSCGIANGGDEYEGCEPVPLTTSQAINRAIQTLPQPDAVITAVDKIVSSTRSSEITRSPQIASRITTVSAEERNVGTDANSKDRQDGKGGKRGKPKKSGKVSDVALGVKSGSKGKKGGGKNYPNSGRLAMLESITAAPSLVLPNKNDKTTASGIKTTKSSVAQPQAQLEQVPNAVEMAWAAAIGCALALILIVLITRKIRSLSNDAERESLIGSTPKRTHNPAQPSGNDVVEPVLRVSPLRPDGAQAISMSVWSRSKAVTDGGTFGSLGMSVLSSEELLFHTRKPPRSYVLTPRQAQGLPRAIKPSNIGSVA